MENSLFIIEARYETFTTDGKKFIDWFVYDGRPYTKDDATKKIKEIKENFEFIDKRTKLRHEYRISSYQEYIDNLNNLNKSIEESKKQYDKYLKSDEYKELLKKKRKSAKERKEKQKQYLEYKKK